MFYHNINNSSLARKLDLLLEELRNPDIKAAFEDGIKNKIWRVIKKSRKRRRK